MKYSKMTLAHTFKMITENTELTEQKLMQMTIKEIEELHELVATSLRVEFELKEKIKMLKKGLDK